MRETCLSWKPLRSGAVCYVASSLHLQTCVIETMGVQCLARGWPLTCQTLHVKLLLTPVLDAAACCSFHGARSVLSLPWLCSLPFLLGCPGRSLALSTQQCEVPTDQPRDRLSGPGPGMWETAKVNGPFQPNLKSSWCGWWVCVQWCFLKGCSVV